LEASSRQQQHLDDKRLFDGEKAFPNGMRIEAINHAKLIFPISQLMMFDCDLRHATSNELKKALLYTQSFKEG